MVTPSPASIVVMSFPFSDLSATKLRPAVVFLDTGRSDWLLCPITSKPYGDTNTICLTNAELKHGRLNTISYARPIKLFTANESLMVKRIAVLTDDAFNAILAVTIEALRKSIMNKP